MQVMSLANEMIGSSSLDEKEYFMVGTIELAKRAAQKQLKLRNQDHVHIYKLDKKFDLAWSDKDNNAELPEGAEIVVHGVRTMVPSPDGQGAKITWEK